MGKATKPITSRAQGAASDPGVVKPGPKAKASAMKSAAKKKTASSESGFPIQPEQAIKYRREVNRKMMELKSQPTAMTEGDVAYLVLTNTGASTPETSCLQAQRRDNDGKLYRRVYARLVFKRMWEFGLDRELVMAARSFHQVRLSDPDPDHRPLPFMNNDVCIYAPAWAASGGQG